MLKTITSILTIILLSSLTVHPTYLTEPDKPDIFIKISDTLSTKDSIRTELIQEVDKYITSRFPDTRLTAESLVLTCEKYNFDLVFAMTQGQIESGFGTAGKAKHTNSVWNVGQYDGRSIQTMNKLGLNFTHPDQSIEPYIVLVQTKYLGDKRTYKDLMNRYVSINGHRYASSKGYENMLQSTYKYIVRKTKIQELYEQLI